MNPEVKKHIDSLGYTLRNPTGRAMIHIDANKYEYKSLCDWKEGDMIEVGLITSVPPFRIRPLQAEASHYGYQFDGHVTWVKFKYRYRWKPHLFKYSLVKLDYIKDWNPDIDKKKISSYETGILLSEINFMNLYGQNYFRQRTLKQNINIMNTERSTELHQVKLVDNIRLLIKAKVPVYLSIREDNIRLAHIAIKSDKNNKSGFLFHMGTRNLKLTCSLDNINSTIEKLYKSEPRLKGKLDLFKAHTYFIKLLQESCKCDSFAVQISYNQRLIEDMANIEMISPSEKDLNLMHYSIMLYDLRSVESNRIKSIRPECKNLIDSIIDNKVMHANRLQRLKVRKHNKREEKKQLSINPRTKLTKREKQKLYFADNGLTETYNSFIYLYYPNTGVFNKLTSKVALDIQSKHKDVIKATRMEYRRWLKTSNSNITNTKNNNTIQFKRMFEAA
jgi:hypothetical protein